MRQSLIRDTGVLKLDPWLSPFQDSLKRRYAKAQEWIKRINETEGGLDKFSKVPTAAHPRLGFGVWLTISGHRHLWLARFRRRHHCLPRMGPQCSKGVAHRRLQ
jgi:hypothetical protein